MGFIGNVMMYAAMASVVVTIISAVLGARSDDPAQVRNAERATYVTAALVSGAVLALQIALVTLDFSLAYIGEYTSTTLSIPYRIGSMWAGMSGSLLLWGWIVVLLSAWLVYANRRKGLGISSYAYAISAAYGGLFVMMSMFNSNDGPFAPATGAIAEGMGLNPLLQDPLQLIHPLFLYGGFVLYTLPFAVICGQLVAGKIEGSEWLTFARTWATLSWISLTIGIVLGARWAYAELGWGGYWAWDPVENASLIPWLTGTVVLHLGLAHRGNRNRLRMRSAVMLMVTFNLCLFGTFLTRSGVIQSVHAFGESNLGPVLGGAIVLGSLGSGALLLWRLPQLQYRDEAAHSHGWFGQMLLTVLLSLMTIAVTWLTLFPLFSRAFRGQEISTTPHIYNVVLSPMGVALLVLFAVSPFLPNQRIENTAREAAIRAVIFGGVFGVMFLLTDFEQPGVAFVIAVSVLAVKTVIWKARRPIGGAMKTGSDRWWNVAHASSPYFAHLGLIVMLAAITLNHAGEVKEQVKVEVGRTVSAAGVELRLDMVQVQIYPDRASFQAHLSIVDEGGNATGNIVSMLERFNNVEQLQAQVGILSRVMTDIYVVVDEADATPGAQWTRLTVYNNPFINWVWFGGFNLGLGGIFYLLPTLRRRRAVPAADVAAPAPALGVAAVDSELRDIIDTAILAVRAGIDRTANERVNSLMATARDLSGGDAATPEQVVGFLERARGGATGSSARTAMRLSRNAMLGIRTAVVLVIGVGAYVSGSLNSAAIPGITDPTSSASASSGVDQTKIAEYMVALTANPNDTITLWNLGNTYLDAADYTNALTFYEKLTLASPDDPNVWIASGAAAYNRWQLAGSSMADRADLDLAFDRWMQATKVDPKNAEAHLNLGYWYSVQIPAKDAQSKSEWETAVKLAPKSQIALQAHLQLGFWYLRQTPKQELEAKAEWEIVIKMDRTSELAGMVRKHMEQLGMDTSTTK